MNIKQHFKWGAFLDGTYYIKPLSPLGINTLASIVPAEFRQPKNYDIDNKTLMLDNSQLADHVINTVENMEANFTFTIE